MPRSPCIALALLLSGASFGGGVYPSTGPTKLTQGPRVITGLQSAAGVGPVVGLRWIGRSGAPVVRRLPAPADLFTGCFVAPPGEWADLDLVLDGPVRIDGLTAAGALVGLDLDLAVLAVALDEPARGGDCVAVSLDLPAWLAEDADREGGLALTPGHPDHDALAAALADGARGAVGSR